MMAAELAAAPEAETGGLSFDGLARSVLESSPDIVAVYDADRRLRVISDTCCTLLGLPREQILGRTTLEMLESSEYLARARDTFEVLHEMVGLVIDSGISHVDDDGSRLTRDGEVQPASIRIIPVRHGGQVVGATFTAHDLEMSGSMMFRRAAVGMAHVDRRGNVREANDALLGMVGAESLDVHGKRFVDLLHPADFVRGTRLLYEVLHGHATDRQAELRICRGGDEWWVLLSASSNQLGVSGPGGACVVVQDIDERVRLQRDLEQARQHLEALALHDALTGLPNRAFLAGQMKSTQAEARISGAHTAVLFVDLDDFKQVNDSAGHELGDELLRLVADRLRALLRPADFAARLGGDEFIVCCTGLDADATAATLAAEAISARIVDAVAEPFEVGGRCWQIGASVGTALSSAGELSPAELLRRADSEMYRIKATR